ncbi:hypothetical protein MBANPS3_012184 [Mucor bainieri]
MAFNCNILFIGINPSASDTSASYFETSNNRFFTLATESGIFNQQVTTSAMATELYNVEFANYCQRSTRTEKELTADKMIQGKQALEETIAATRPRLLCFIGKKCCQHFSYTSRVDFGLQPTEYQSGRNSLPIYCLPRGSGRVNMTHEAKLQQYQAFAHYIHRVL